MFGNQARNETHEGSDVDLILIKNTKKRFTKRIEEVLSKIEYDIDLDVFVYTPKEFNKMKSENNPFIKNALKEGIII